MVLVSPFLVAAGPTVPADSYVCTITQGVECDVEQKCGPPALEVPAPTFLHVDLASRRITLLGPPERRGETTPVEYIEQNRGRWILAGVQGARPWSMIFPEEGGAMTLTANLGDAGWIVGGQCIAAAALTP
jgi:hypothetical protein